jgi:fructoselysine-6-phosphate deglycase
MIFKGEDATRSLAERVEAFLPRVTDKTVVLDTADCELPGISPETRRLLSHVVLASVLERLSA